MSIRRTVLCTGAWALMVASLYGGPVMAVDPSASNAEHRLMEQIHLGESMYREDIVQDAVARLYRMAPDHPHALAAELRQAVRQQQLERARQLLKQLATIAPGSEIYRSARILMLLNTPEGQQDLARARLLSAAGRVDQARQAYDDIFGGVFPTTDLALEYWQLRARQPGERPAALKQLLALLDTEPEHGGLLMTVGRYSLSEDQPDQALHYLHKLARQPLQREQAANLEYEYLNELPVSIDSARLWSDFVSIYDGVAVADKAREELKRQQTLLGDAAWQAGQQGLRSLDSGKNSQALQQLKLAVAAYPDDAELNGALGLAYLRAGDRAQALKYFQNAKDKEPRAGKTSKWVSLIQATRYWLLLQQASAAAHREDWAAAQRLYSQANQQDPRDVFALVGLGDTALAMDRPEAAWRYFQRALTLAPRDETAQRGVIRYLETLAPRQAIGLLAALPGNSQPLLAAARLQLELDDLKLQAQGAQEQLRWQQAADLLVQAQRLDPDDPWLSYRLALALRQQGLENDALSAYQTHLARHSGAPASHYAHALLLSSADRWQDAQNTLLMVPSTAWTEDMHELGARLQQHRYISQASAIYDAGRKDEAIALLEHGPESDSTRMQVADWSLAGGDYAKALFNYGAILRNSPANLDARLGQLETWTAQGKREAVRHALDKPDFVVPEDDPGAGRRIAALWVELGDRSRARQLLQQMATRQTTPNPVLYRDLARVTADDQPQAALKLYARAMQDAQILPAHDAGYPGNKLAFTRATREQDADDWLRRSIRHEAQALYLQQTPTLTIHNDTSWRSDGTPGLSRLTANTTILHLDYPVKQGKAFLRAEHVRMDAGTFQTEDGDHDSRFGTCSFAADSVQGQWQALPGCSNGLKQTARGTSMAIGWQGERLAFDLGRTPQGFPVTNWVGGASYRGDLKSLGWKATLSRRPMSNSLLSFAGTQDPRTGIIWGGVIATGLSLGLSWDQGEKHGVWADISHHRLTGENVADNHRSRLMAGYYHRLINKADVSLIAGVNVMYWRHQKDLGEYTLGHGGYYSPQRYSSISLPVSYARRSANWAFLLEGSVSASVAKSKDTPYYPLAGPISGPMQQLQRQGVSSTTFAAANTMAGGTSNGVGYSVRAVAERRLTKHWVLGAGIDWQHSKDYSPNRAMLYLRYTFEPWAGNLKLRSVPLTPYADFN